MYYISDTGLVTGFIMVSKTDMALKLMGFRV